MIRSVLLATLLAQTLPDASQKRIARDMTTLSDTAMEGRRPGTPGEAAALRAIVAAFTASGLGPAARSGWFQPVALVERVPRTARLTVAGLDLDLSDGIGLLSREPAASIANAPIVYAGHADDETDVRGAIVLFRDMPRPGRSLEPGTDDVGRRASLVRRGALATLAIVDDRLLARWRLRAGQGVIEAADSPRARVQGVIAEAAVARLLAARGLTPRAFDARSLVVAPAGTIRATATVRRFTSMNVVGRIVGRTVPDQALLYTAHWDAFGRCRPGERDAICHGAVDNASGVAGIVEIARLFNAGPAPDRSIVFVATTAEEHDLLGSRAYVADPVVPLSKTVASINIDTIALYSTGHPVGVVGAALSDADAIIADEAYRQGRTLDTGEGTRFVAQSSDAWPLLQAGVPAFVLSGTIAGSGADSGAAFREMITRRLHTPADTMANAGDLGGATEDVALAYRIGLRFASRQTWIRFRPDSPFQRR